MERETRTRLRQIPSIDRLLLAEEVAGLLERYPRDRVVDALRAATDSFRAALRSGGRNGEGERAEATILAEAARRLEDLSRPSLRRAINATGVVLHTGLGRAVLSKAAIGAVMAVAGSHSLLEVDAETGERGSRQAHVRALVRQLTGAEEALVVNNNAAGVLLSIAALAVGREVIISRGQLVEIGGSFRIPDVIRHGGGRLVEVGTTNKTRLSDYRSALTGETALILRVHPSNFRIVGFTEEAPLSDLVAVAHQNGLPLMDDLGSGALIDLRVHGLMAEPTVQESVAAGADVVTFSGDKLLGGPQCGLIVGRSEYLASMARHPLMRVVRCDKMTLAALEATLRLYLDEETALQEVPTLRALVASPETLRARADRLAEGLVGTEAEVTVEQGISQVGGGSLPGEALPSPLVHLRPRRISAAVAARALRLGEPSVFCRIQRDALVFDLRTVTEPEIELLTRQVVAVLKGN